MALTLTNKHTFNEGHRRGTDLTAAFDNSYTTGGLSLSLSDFGFVSDVIDVDAKPTAGFFFQYDYTAYKLKVYTAFNTYTATVDPASMNTDTVANTDVTVTGALTTDIVQVIPPQALEAGIVVQSAWVQAADTVRLRLANTKSGTVDPASATWTFNLLNATGALKEVKNGTDLSGLTGVIVRALGK